MILLMLIFSNVYVVSFLHVQKSIRFFCHSDSSYQLSIWNENLWNLDISAHVEYDNYIAVFQLVKFYMKSKLTIKFPIFLQA